jgi:carbohydrate-binding DOMON domain-containing protein
MLTASIIRATMESVSTSETSVNFYQTTQRYNPEDSHLRIIYQLTCSFAVWTLILRAINGIMSGEMKVTEDVAVKTHIKAIPFCYTTDVQPVFRGTPVCRRGHLRVPRNFHLSL